MGWRMATVAIFLAAAGGCGGGAPVTAPAPRAEPEPPLAPFVGKPAPAITWDLWGDWTLTRTARADGKAGAPGRFDESWHLRRRADRTNLVWVDPGRGETFTLLPGNGKGDRLRWRRCPGKVFDFSVNRQSYGLLVMTDQDGENYMAVRSEGGD